MEKSSRCSPKTCFPRAYQVKISNDGKSLCVGDYVLYANDLNDVELLTPAGWKEVLLELDDSRGWIATTEMYSKENGVHVDTLNINPVGMYARILQR